MEFLLRQRRWSSSIHYPSQLMLPRDTNSRVTRTTQVKALSQRFWSLERTEPLSQTATGESQASLWKRSTTHNRKNTAPADFGPRYRSSACQLGGYKWELLSLQEKASLGEQFLRGPERLGIPVFTTAVQEFFYTALALTSPAERRIAHILPQSLWRPTRYFIGN